MDERLKQDRRTCTCCPYGFHIDVDFLNSIERCSKRTPPSKSWSRKQAPPREPVQEAANLKELMRNLSKYLDEAVQPDRSQARSKLHSFKSLATGSDDHVTLPPGQPQTVPRTLHRQNLNRTFGLKQLSSRSLSEDDNQRNVFSRKSLDAQGRDHPFQGEKSTTPTCEELLEMKAQVKSVMERLVQLEEREGMILSLEEKISSMNSERERLLLKLCGRCKNLLNSGEGPKAISADSTLRDRHHVCRTQSLKAFKPVGIQKTPSGIPAPANSIKLQVLIPQNKLEVLRQTNGQTKRDFDDEFKTDSRPADHQRQLQQGALSSHRGRPTQVKINPKLNRGKDAVRSNVTQISKLSHLPRLVETPQTPPKPTSRPLKNTNSKIPFAGDRQNSRLKNSLKIESGITKLEIPSVTRSNSLDATGRHLNDHLTPTNDSSSDDNAHSDEMSVGGRKEQRRICRRSLSLVTPSSRVQLKATPRVTLSSSEEELGVLNGCNSDYTSDQSSTSFDEGAYDGELGRIIYKQKLGELSS